MENTVITDRSSAENPMRERILGAAFEAFTEDGYAGTSALEIARRANVSKRDLQNLSPCLTAASSSTTKTVLSDVSARCGLGCRVAWARCPIGMDAEVGLISATQPRRFTQARRVAPWPPLDRACQSPR